MTSLIGIGVMSGTSLDGLDIVAVKFSLEEKDSYSYEILASGAISYPEQWQVRLANLMDQSAEIFAKTHVYYGHYLGKAIQDFVENHKLSPDFVGVHGHTIFHQPEKNFTSQIGDGETIASYLSCPIVTNFRTKDVALGGQGAPLVPLGEHYLFPPGLLFLNLGGFCNLAAGNLAFDIGSCNGILNFLAQSHDPALSYDPEGKLAASGSFSQELYDTLQALSFYSEPPPKSLGWEWVRSELIPIFLPSPLPLVDQMHTYCLHIADQIYQALKLTDSQGKELRISGGGVHNSFLMECIRKRFKELEITENFSTNRDFVDFKEALVFAFLALRTLTGKNTIFASVTGASTEACTGSIHLPPQPHRAWFN